MNCAGGFHQWTRYLGAGADWTQETMDQTKNKRYDFIGSPVGVWGWWKGFVLSTHPDHRWILPDFTTEEMETARQNKKKKKDLLQSLGIYLFSKVQFQGRLPCSYIIFDTMNRIRDENSPPLPRSEEKEAENTIWTLLIEDVNTENGFETIRYLYVNSRLNHKHAIECLNKLFRLGHFRNRLLYERLPPVINIKTRTIESASDFSKPISL
jgi:hypothetical protein